MTPHTLTALLLRDIVTREVNRCGSRPTPNSRRPLLRTSSVAASSAIFTGLCSGKSVTAVLTRIRLVRCAAAARIISGEARQEKLGMKCSSPNHAVSNPSFVAQLDLSEDVLVTLTLRLPIRSRKLVKKAKAH